MNLYLWLFVLGLALLALGIFIEKTSSWRERVFGIAMVFGIGLVIYGIVMSVAVVASA